MIHNAPTASRGAFQRDLALIPTDTGERPYKCPTCRKHFARRYCRENLLIWGHELIRWARDVLLRHRRNHSSEDGKKLPVCVSL